MTGKEALEKLCTKQVAIALFNIVANGEYDMNEIVPYFDRIDKAIAELEQLKRYPTADEVCKALSKWVKNNIPDVYNCKVYHDLAGFHYYNNCDYEEYLVEYERIDKTISLSVFLPPHLVTLIGRFYEGLEKAGKEE